MSFTNKEKKVLFEKLSRIDINVVDMKPEVKANTRHRHIVYGIALCVTFIGGPILGYILTRG